MTEQVWSAATMGNSGARAVLVEVQDHDRGFWSAHERITQNSLPSGSCIVIQSLCSA